MQARPLSESEILHHTLAGVIDVPFDFIDGKTKSRKGVPYIVLVQGAIRVSVNDDLVPCGIRTICLESLGIGKKAGWRSDIEHRNLHGHLHYWESSHRNFSAGKSGRVYRRTTPTYSCFGRAVRLRDRPCVMSEEPKAPAKK